MQYTVEDVSSVKKTLHIEIPQDEVARELEKAYNQLKKNAKIKGFPAGEGPPFRFGANVQKRCACRCIFKTYSEFVHRCRQTDRA